VAIFVSVGLHFRLSWKYREGSLCQKLQYLEVCSSHGLRLSNAGSIRRHEAGHTWTKQNITSSLHTRSDSNKWFSSTSNPTLNLCLIAWTQSVVKYFHCGWQHQNLTVCVCIVEGLVKDPLQATGVSIKVKVRTGQYFKWIEGLTT
jgi:hypothetical protein